MNPAVMNYLQSQQQQQPNNQVQQGQTDFNPFDAGIARAISSARESLGMTEKQQDKAMRSSLLTFADNIAQQPKQRGFFKNFGSAARALSPAIRDYDQSEDQALQQNNNLANQILAYKAAEEKKQGQLENQAWGRQHAENQLGEQKRYHDMAMDLQRQKLVNNQQQAANIGVNSQLDSRFKPIESKMELNAYAKDKKAFGSVLQEMSELEKDYTKFRKDYTENLVDPMSAYGTVANPVKDLFGRLASNKMLRKETADRKTLESRLNKFVVSSERALKGGGVMGPKLIELFKEQGIYPDLARDNAETFESKLKMLKGELENAYKASNLSLQHGVRIDPYDLKDFESFMKEENVQNANVQPNEQEMNMQQNTNEVISMRDSSGSVYQIPSNEVNDAMKDGLTPIQ